VRRCSRRKDFVRQEKNLSGGEGVCCCGLSPLHRCTSAPEKKNFKDFYRNAHTTMLAHRSNRNLHLATNASCPSCPLDEILIFELHHVEPQTPETEEVRRSIHFKPSRKHNHYSRWLQKSRLSTRRLSLACPRRSFTMDRLAVDADGCRPLQMVYSSMAVFRCFNLWIYASEYLLRSCQASKHHQCMAISRPNDIGWSLPFVFQSLNGTSMTSTGGAWIILH